jgi:hypothetical protein
MEIILSMRGRFGIVIGSDAILICLCINGTFPVDIGSRVFGGYEKGFAIFIRSCKKLKRDR